jgi:hypothetical protein
MKGQIVLQSPLFFLVTFESPTKPRDRFGKLKHLTAFPAMSIIPDERPKARRQ